MCRQFVLEGDLSGGDLTRFQFGTGASLTATTPDLQSVTPPTQSDTITAAVLLCTDRP
ncbi:MAG: hypothetical protein IV100_07360 [Myxococcales bacterium]|nr:hypothetical protein [Myxococcales bacterium]